MATPPGITGEPRSRGHSLFDRQAQLHSVDADKSSSPNVSYKPKPLPPLRSSHSIASPPVSTSSVSHHHQTYSPLPTHRRTPSIPTDSSAHSNTNNVQLLSVHPRPESNYIKETHPSAPLPSSVSSKLLETDFPLHENGEKEELENVIPNDATCTAVIEQAFDYLTTHDDDDDVIHQESTNEQEYNSDSFDDDNEDNSVNPNDLDATASTQHHQHDSKFFF
jgi:hypothetical protein